MLNDKTKTKSLQDSSQNSQAINQYRCFGSYTFTPCYQNFDPFASFLCTGNDIFLTYTNPTIQNFATSGWIFLKGNENQNYNILTVLQGSQVLFRVKYNIPGNYFSVQLHSNSAVNMIYSSFAPYTIKQQWYFLQFYMEVTTGSQLNLNTYIYENKNNYFSSQQQKLGIGFNSFIAADLVFDFGNGQSIYEGGFLSQTNSCFMLAARKDQQCIICRSGYLLDYQNNMICVTPSSSNQSTLINNVKDWTPKQFTCPKNMILDSQNICKCFFQFYRRGDECFQCQSYCKGCIDANTCIEMDSQRQSNGICKNGYFDDGYTCLKPKFIIRSRINQTINLIASDLGAGCSQDGTQPSYITDNSILKIQKERGFFFCFIILGYNLLTQSTIAFIQDSGIELFTIMFEMNNNNGYSMPSFSLFVQGVRKQILFYNQNNLDWLWIAFQTDFNTANFHLFSNLNLYTAVIDVKSQFSSYTVNDPFLCIGKCSSQFQPSYACANYGLLYYINQLDQLGDYSQIENLINHLTNQVAFFKLDYSNLPTSNYIIDPISSLRLQSNLNLIIKRFKGIQFTQNINARIEGLILNSNYPTFSCNIFIEKLSMEQMIFNIQSGSQYLQYFLVPYGETKAQIRMCHDSLCIDTKYSMLNINQQNFLYLIFRTRGQINSQTFEKFEIFCNYQREEIQFAYPSPDNNPKTALIFQQVNQLNLQDQSVYINKIRIELQSGSYYYDYDNSERCFLFRNILQMECLIPKKGFVFFSNNQIISEDECNKMTSILNSFHTIDPSAHECVDTGLSPYCIMLDDSSQNFMCIKCQYSSQDPSKNCECPFGTFLNQKILSCQKCSPNCLTCINTFDNCIKCANSNQSPPQCSCQEQNYYLDENFTCKMCSYQCDTCIQNSNYCLTCSKDRENPPICNCKQQFNEVNKKCEKIECDQKCLTCVSSSSNCTQCKNGRMELAHNATKDSFMIFKLKLVNNAQYSAYNV
ncbi:bowman-birk serine protease inhibitor family protein (macronuclear) [Tetrahymena thermophila SB210]|uniref:Bowman-birk serine protease inhibitor family protein n=1 Tax=Tetrahymena thermophila (strain SB210) TaxID=312017 RepID=W7XC68_TETTS|nr:bowman-birk serine protease inhibitor family protein [Tetrahymena thermophila SB210]EWS71301.1 bowman-birk serine protease inhibitor family protein [Tetrahymena thermophila SB210]|eukprot:XP_012656165.1 bowman-birk serine protease inhibitor family protein [Tetrahymena thermophila SB210]